MFTGKDFEIFGKVAASKYINGNIPLDKTITKLAGHYGLNSEQITRVVEHANIETYLKLNKVAENKYIEFETANPTKIASSLSFDVQKKAALLDDYVTLDIDENLSSISKYDKDDLERLSKSETKILEKKANDLKQTVNKKLEELDENFSRGSEKLYKLIKQAALELGEFDIVKQAMLLAVPGGMTGLIVGAYETRLKKEASSKINFTEIEKSAGKLNTEHPIVKQLLKLSILKEEYQSFLQLKQILEKNAAIPGLPTLLAGTGQLLKGTGQISIEALRTLGKTMTKAPWLAALAGGAVVGTTIGKAKGRQESSKTNVRMNKGNMYVQRAKNLKPL